jgi:hypothetical protein
VPKRSRSPVEKQARVILKSLGAIAEALARLVAVAKAAEGGKRPAANGGRRRLELSPKRRAALKLQGQYIGHLRNLKPRQKAQVKALRAEKGFRAAIAMAKRMAKGLRA